jgi:hypothetical protein
VPDDGGGAVVAPTDATARRPPFRGTRRGGPTREVTCTTTPRRTLARRRTHGGLTDSWS